MAGDSGTRTLATDGRVPERLRWHLATASPVLGLPRERAAVLAAKLGMNKAKFKLRVGKLKALGLTESLEIGYRLSPRGRAAWKQLA